MIVEALDASASALIRHLHHKFKPKPARRGATIRPGRATPLWLSLVGVIRPHLRQRGAKAQLARVLGLNRSRVSQFVTTRSAMPDAERTLLLLSWLAAKQRGEEMT